jgi:hypothetical protein
MDALHLQPLGGWEGLEMVKLYAQLVDDDLLRSHKAHNPIDNSHGYAKSKPGDLAASCLIC